MKKLVFTFGRMNPPTIGHEKLVNKMKVIASKEKADARLYLSHTNKPGSDPLSYNDKLKFAQKAFGIAYKSNAKQIFQIAKELQGQGYTDIVMVVGSDRVSEFSTLLKKYNGKGDYDFKSIKVVSAGQRDPDATGVAGMSGTKLRNLAKAGDSKTFMSGLASTLSNIDKKKIYVLVKKNMNEAAELDEAKKLPPHLAKFFDKKGNMKPEVAKRISTGKIKFTIKDVTPKGYGPDEELDESQEQIKKLEKMLKDLEKNKKKTPGDGYAKIKIRELIANLKSKKEEVELEEKPLTVQQRVARGRQMRRLAPKLARAREKKKKRMADPRALKMRAQKAAIKLVRKKVAGKKGINYNNLSPSDKSNVDKLVMKKQALVRVLAKKLLPMVRKAEQERLAKLKQNKNEDFNQVVENFFQEGPQTDRVKDRIDFEKERDATRRERDIERAKEADKQNDEREKEREKARIEREKEREKAEKEREKREEYNISESEEISLRKKANKSSISYDIIKEVFDRGMKSWDKDNHSELSQQQWAFARVNSFITDGKTIVNDADLWKISINEQVEKVLDERNYRKEYDNYHSRPEQIARRSSRNQARRIMGDKTVVGQDVGHKDNNPLNNSPNNLRNEDPSDNRKEPRLRFNELAWYTRAKHKIDQATHPKQFKALVARYVELMKQPKYKGKNSMAAAEVAMQTRKIEPRELIGYINKLVGKGILPKQLKAEYNKEDMQTEEGGAGEFGTTEATNRYKMDTPGEAYNPDDDFDIPIKSKKKKAGK